MNWCISLHWKQLPRRRQEEGETGGKRGRREGEAVQRKGAGGWGEDGGRTTGSGGRKPRGCRAVQRRAGVCSGPWLFLDWLGIDSRVTLEGSAPGVGAVGSGGGLSLH